MFSSAKKLNAGGAPETADPHAPSEAALPCRHSSISAADKEGPLTHEAWGIHPPAPRQGTEQPLCSSEVQLQIPLGMAPLPRR